MFFLLASCLDSDCNKESFFSCYGKSTFSLESLSNEYGGRFNKNLFNLADIFAGV